MLKGRHCLGKHKKSRSRHVSKLRQTEVDLQRDFEDVGEDDYIRWGRGARRLEDVMEWIEMIKYECIKGRHSLSTILYSRISQHKQL